MLEAFWFGFLFGCSLATALFVSVVWRLSRSDAKAWRYQLNQMISRQVKNTRGN